MSLTYERLIRFDLLNVIEKDLFEENRGKDIAEFFTTMQEVVALDQFVKDSPSYPGSTDKIVRDELISAIGATLAIEGTALGKEEIEESFRKADLNEKLKRKEQEAENSRKVYEFIIELVDRDKGGFLYDERMIRQIHKYFTGEMNYLSNTPGEYHANLPITFGEPRRRSLCRTQSEVEQAMTQLVASLNHEGSGILTGNIIVKAIMAHYYLTEIHPFGDGNGRTARALESLILYVNGINTYCFWSLANFWSQNKDRYLAHLGEIYNTCDPWPFLLWGMKGYRDELRRIKDLVLTKVKRLMLIDYTRYLLENKRNEKIKINQRIADLMKLLVTSGRVRFKNFASSPHIAALYHSVSPSTRSRDFKKMQQLKLVKILEENGELYLQPNYEVLEQLIYGV